MAGNLHLMIKYGMKKGVITKKKIFIFLIIIVLIIACIIVYNKYFSLKSRAAAKAVQFLDEYLNSASTGKYTHEVFRIRKEDNEILIRGYVDFENSFGIEVRRSYRIIMFIDELSPKRIILNGQVVYD